MDSLFVFGSAFLAQQDTTIDRFNQLQGRDLLGVFEEDSLKTLYGGPNARVIYFMKDDEGSLSWAVRLSGDDASFRFLGGGRTDVTFGRGNEGTAYPPEHIPEPMTLDRFRWTPELRPTLPNLVDIQRVLQRGAKDGEDASIAGHSDNTNREQVIGSGTDDRD